MENNLEDILVDNIEEKPSSKSKAKLIIIAFACFVLVAVLGTLAYVLLNSEPKKNPEFNNTELEKIVPQERQADYVDKLIEEIKSNDPANQPKTPLPSEESVNRDLQVEEKPIKPNPEKPEGSSINKPEVKPAIKPEAKIENKIENNSTTQNKPVAPTKEPQKKVQKQEKKKETQKENKKSLEKKVPSASKVFESVKTAVVPQGFYLQVGVFGGKPQKAFISKLSSFQYKTETLQKNGKILTRYLIGPYSNRDQAEAMISNVMQTINTKPIIVEVK